MKFYEIYFDAEHFPDRWHLDDPIDEYGNIIDANLLPQIGPYIGPRIDKVQVDIRYPGQSLDFSFGYFNFLMVKNWVAEMIEAHGGKIQRFPVSLEPTGEVGYEVIFALDAAKGLIDLSRAKEYEYYEESDLEVDLRHGGISPRQKGMFYKLYPLYIHAERASSLTFFRPWEKDLLIISESLKLSLEHACVTGLAYRSVT